MATGSSDTSIKLLDVQKMKNYNQMKSEHGEDYAPAKPVIRTFYDHSNVCFHSDCFGCHGDFFRFFSIFSIFFIFFSIFFYFFLLFSSFFSIFLFFYFFIFKSIFILLLYYFFT